MREEILFRGKRLDNGAWETGSLVTERWGLPDARVYIADKMTAYHTPVDPDTVGQFTGHTDRNGKPIFEGDIIKYHGEPFKVVWRNTSFQARAKDGLYMAWVYISDDENDAGEIAGNLFDNPEIMNE